VYRSIPHSFWWAIVTLTTVGYGDAVPITLGGRIFASLFILIGMISIAALTGLVASALTQIRKGE